MLAVGISADEARALIARHDPTVSIAAFNGPKSLTLSGLRTSLERIAEDRHLLRVSRWMTLGWGLVQIAVALSFYAFTDRSALDIALSVASLFNGPVLGLFLVGSFVRRADGRAALAGALIGSAVMATIFFAELADPSKIHLFAWPWYAGIGSLVTLGAAIVASYVLPARPSDGTTTASLR